MHRVLITVPDLSISGGVSNIYRSIKWDESDQVSYFYNTSPNVLSKFWFVPMMVIRFLTALKNVKLVQLNPSLDFKAVIRDGILLLLSKLLGKQVIVFFHGWDDKFESRIANNAAYRKMFSLTFNQANVFFVLGSVFKAKLNGLGILNENVFFMPTVADDAYLDRTPIKDNQWITLLFISRFVPLKGIEVVLNTFSYLQRNFNHFNFKLILAGDGPDFKKSVEYSEKLKLQHVEFTGHVEGFEKHICYSKADFLFFPSYSEGLPCVIMEAMLYGLVIITRPVGGIPDWVKHNVNGFLSESNQPEVFARGIIEFAKKPELMDTIKKRNQAIAKDKFTPVKFKQGLMRIYEHLLSD